ncbi:extracellular solute-binding protein [Phenylobacterium sp.]|uniref:extracellular solute-binding protein n=1 Tax=Phenylobacterium sp. TaxID=1871053 RepID=UPI002B8648A1|nr:extracellular solute-binding protein [Phenylobacterium sp.]HLZ74796.1 extracellular solute-binding protein [Phenylobacterium sp.]
MRAFGPVVAAALAALFVLPAAIPSARAADVPNAPPALTVYSDRHQTEDAQLFAQFTKATGIPVDLVDEDFDPLLERLTKEGQHTGADLVLSVGAATLWRCAQAGLLQPITSETILQAVPANLRDKTNQWIGLVYWARVIAYEKDRFKPEDVANYEDLADPKFQGQILVRSASSLYNQALVASMIASLGTAPTETWARGLVANLARPPQGGDTNQLQAMAEGEGSVSIINTRYWARFAASDKVTEQEVVANVGLAFPNQANRGTEVDIAGAGISRWSAHPRAAAMLLEFLLKPEVQKQFAAANFEYPVVAGVEPAPVLAGLGPFKIDSLAVGKLGKFAPEADEAMARAGWE